MPKISYSSTLDGLAEIHRTLVCGGIALVKIGDFIAGPPSGLLASGRLLYCDGAQLSSPSIFSFCIGTAAHRAMVHNDVREKTTVSFMFLRKLLLRNYAIGEFPALRADHT